MLNKKIEERLKKHGYVDIINLLEKCEAGHVSEIRIDKKRGFTSSKVLDRMIFVYLEKINVQVLDIEMSHKTKEKKINKCAHQVHLISSDKLSKSKKIAMLTEVKGKLFKLDENSTFVICPDCFSILPVK
jgi:hypothetical protein